MNKIQNDKRKKIKEIVSIVKLASILFVGIGIFEQLFSENKICFNNTNSVFYSFFVIIPISILLLIYFIWAFSTSSSIKSKYFSILQVIENVFFMVIFFLVVLFTGAYTSDFKFLFLFLIITSTIELGIKHGVTIACISSILILGVDLIYGSNSEINQFFQNDLILVGVFILTAWPLGYYVKTESEHIKKLEDLANKDGLTDVYNHRFFYDALKEKVEISEKENNRVSMIFIDIDYFKYYNDMYGHQEGDKVLKKVADLLQNGVNTEDIVARYGGEEFAIILPNTNEVEAKNMAEKLRIQIEQTYFEGEENQPNGKVTVSIGISVYPDKAKSEIDLIKSADDALYKAKFFNKNRVEIYTSILDELKKDIAEEHIDLITSIKTLISVINAKDKYTYGHVERVVSYSRLLADKLELCEEDKKTLVYGAYMHDIGKINIPKQVLNKKMALTNDEWNMLKEHTQNGLDIVKSVDSLQNISPLILHHHERFDGTGYPSNLKGDEIPYLVRVLTVVDSFDAMTSNRPYNKAKTYEEAVEELKRCSGTQFDPEIAKAFIEVIVESNSL
ncbi:diguanylate cyclase [Clostridium sediminicola]|uniref:bifunctional diguanylate cyclase/phosphohydrolase n=1 Tax=Clostridium sediminicola TaxID=3114879 RepID=UPI0031F253B3